MKSIQIELPEKLAEQLDEMVKDGWFKSEAEAVRLALLDFVRHHRLELLERFQREDIAWAIKQKGAAGRGGVDRTPHPRAFEMSGFEALGIGGYGGESFGK